MAVCKQDLGLSSCAALEPLNFQLLLPFLEWAVSGVPKRILICAMVTGICRWSCDIKGRASFVGSL